MPSFETDPRLCYAHHHTLPDEKICLIVAQNELCVIARHTMFPQIFGGFFAMPLESLVQVHET